MPQSKRERHQKRKTVPNVSQRPGPSNPSTTSSRRLNPLPTQYTFTPAAQAPPTQSPQGQVPVFAQHSTSTPHIGNYPPPQQLFQTVMPQQREQVQNNRPRQSTQLQDDDASPLRNSQGQNSHPRQSTQLQDDESPLQNSQAQSHPSSQGNNFEEPAPVVPDLDEDTLRALNALLLVPGRDRFTTVLSPEPIPNSTWFTRDKGSKLVRSITKIFTNKFDGPFYTWLCVPRERQERYFLEFAKTHTWDPLITGTVQQEFEVICQRRMKDMVSGVRTSQKRPKWIEATLWETMTAYWATEEAQKRSQTYSDVRMSPREGLGHHVHFSGPKSYLQIQQDLEEELGRPVSLGEVFIKTHTRPDGTYVDQKAEKIVQTYEKNIQEKLAELEAETSIVSDGASRPRELTLDDYTAIFLQSTDKDSRGTPYGLGSLKATLLNGKRKQPGDASSFMALQEQLKEAQRKIEEQAAYNERREAEYSRAVAEHARAAAEQNNKIENLSLMEKYLKQTDPRYIDFVATQSAAAPVTSPPSTS
ncbi:putative transposase-like protein [Cardamine amara subsp. amara]|uniref:Transposase-like protein n=1 Tax=Cardamine amara subsp. amara TaxID=228776 RepID=A0ABD1BH97_CARAN